MLHDIWDAYRMSPSLSGIQINNTLTRWLWPQVIAHRLSTVQGSDQVNFSPHPETHSMQYASDRRHHCLPLPHT